ncbi:MAG: lipid A export permease/ATP-binding protein MsbA [Gammaproteobacteria bacterium]|jgi:subfamily B ATP-binding cassette protein MsbA
MAVVSVDSRGLSVYRRLLGYTTEYRVVLILAGVAMAVSALVEAGIAMLMEPLMDETLLARNERVASWMPIAFIAAFALRGIAGFGSEYGLGWIGRQIITRLRSETFDKYLVLPSSFFDSRSSGPLLSKMTYNIEMVAESATNVVTVLIRDTIKIVSLLAVMIYQSLMLTAFVALVVPLIAILIGFLSKTFRRYSQRIQNSVGDVTQVTEEAVQGHRVVKVFNGQDYERRRFGAANENNRRLNMKLVAAKAGGIAVTQMLFAVGVAGVVYVAGRQSLRGELTPGTFTAFMTAMVFLLDPLRRLTNMNAPLQRGIAAADSVFEVLDREAERDTGTYTAKRVEGRVEYRDVSFAYAEEKGIVLRDVNLSVEPGRTVAIVGRSGSGKSTLVSLLPRFYEPDAGQILLDGRSVEDYTLASLREQISLVSQDVVLFNDTIANNLAYGYAGTVSREKLEEAAAHAYVTEFVRDLPDGMETIVGDRGVLLSGGQRQRIAIARALLKNAPVLILDEATSALDTESERRIQHALSDLMEDRTTLVIAHRLSTIENADLIVVMESGRVIETGTHAELLAREGAYAMLHRMQFSETAT